MNIISMNELLFKTRENAFGKKVNITGPAKMYLSKHHTGTTKTAKISAALVVAENILTGKMEAYSDLDHSLFVVYKSSTGDKIARIPAKGDAVVLDVSMQDDQKPDTMTQYAKKCVLNGIVALDIQESIHKSTDLHYSADLSGVWGRMVEQFETNQTVDEECCFNFCDRYYYEIMVERKDKGYESITVDYTPALAEQLKRRKDAGTLQRLFVDAPEPTAEPEKEAVPQPTASNAYDSIKAGTSVIPYEWDEGQKMRIPAIETLEDYIPSPNFFSLLNKTTFRLKKVKERMDSGKESVAAIKNDYVNVILAGKPAAGKTVMAHAIAAATGMPIYTVAGTKNMEEDTFTGMTKIVDGKFQFTSTDFLEAYKNGGIVVLEEVNLADPAVTMGALGQAIEFPFILMEDGCRPVRRHPMCVIISTMNIGTYGSKGINQAFSSRFRNTYVMNDPGDAEFVAILESKGFPKKNCEWVYTAYTRILQYLNRADIARDDIALGVTLRGCIGALSDIEEGEEPKQAIRNSLIGKIAETDLLIAEEVNSIVLEAMPRLTMKKKVNQDRWLKLE